VANGYCLGDMSHANSKVMAGELGMKIEYYQWADLSAILTGAPLPVVVLPVFSQLGYSERCDLARFASLEMSCLLVTG
jgi:hypothetical protein